MLSVFEVLPVGLLQCSASELHQLLPGPSLIHLPGEEAEPVFISVLLHGNETTGWDAIRQVLLAHQDKSLPRAVSLFIGNVAAAAHGLRHLDEQPDYNRIWRAEEETQEAQMVRQVLADMKQRDVFACIDIHNNTGRNPHYACINRLAAPFFQLATLFSKTVVYFLQPDSVLSMAFSSLCPAATVECGKPDEAQGIEHAQDFILRVLRLSEFEDDSQSLQSTDVFHTVASIKLREGMEVGFLDQGYDLELLPDADQLNFNELPVGSQFAKVHRTEPLPIEVQNEFGKDVTERYFQIDSGWLVNTVPIMPSMLTLDLDVIRQDCLCYLMQKLDLSTSLPG